MTNVIIIEQLKVALNTLYKNPIAGYKENEQVTNAITHAIDALDKVSVVEEVYLPHTSKYVPNEVFYIWEEGERITTSLNYAMANWTELYARVLLDDAALGNVNVIRASGAGYENDMKIRSTAERVLSKWEYIKANTVI